MYRASNRKRVWRVAPVSFTFSALFLLMAINSVSQTKASSTALPSEAETVRSEVLVLRDAFVKDVSAAGLKCSIAPPAIEVHEVPSFGKYDAESNTITTAAWGQLNDQEKEIFLRNHPAEDAAREEFEIGVHHWVLVHEIGHWWQSCTGFNHADHFATELGANRIAAAYWRTKDPSVVAHQRTVFDSIVRHWPNPIPEGQTEKVFFNDNYEKLGPTPAYIWFQARMCLTAIDESPSPSLADVLRQSASER